MSGIWSVDYLQFQDFQTNGLSKVLLETEV